MAKYQKLVIVEARKYEGPKLTVIHDVLGEQTANDGDYLLGNERGKIKVVTAEKFTADYVPCEERFADDTEKGLAVITEELAAAKAQTDALAAQLVAEKRHSDELEAQLTNTQGIVQALEARLNPIPPAA